MIMVVIVNVIFVLKIYDISINKKKYKNLKFNFFLILKLFFVFKMTFYLQDYLTYKDNVSHVSLNGGKYWIPKELYGKLFKFMAKHPEICLTEILLDVFPLFFDIDKLPSILNINELQNIFIENINKILKIDKNNNKNYITKNKSKESYHIYYPKIYVNKNIAKEISNVINEYIKINYEINEDICDISPYNTGLRMFNTLKYNNKLKKSEENTDYEFITKLDDKINTIPKKLKLLCLRKIKTLTELRDEFIYLKPSDNINLDSNNDINDSDNNNNYDNNDNNHDNYDNDNKDILDKFDNYKEIKHILYNCLSEDRLNNNNLWIRIGYILKNLNVPIEIFKEWSKLSKHYNSDDWINKNCNKIYNSRQKNGHELGLNKLYSYAKQDNLKEFYKINLGVSIYEKHTEISNEFIKKCYFKEDFGDAILFSTLYKNRLICSNPKKNVYYYWDGSLWKQDKAGIVKLLIATHLPKLYEQYVFHLEEQWKNNNNDDDDNDDKKKKHKTNVSNIFKRITKCRTNRHISNIIPFLSSLLYDDEINDKFDSNKDILSIKDSILELKTGTIRPRRLTDYCTYELDVEFPGLDYPTNNIDDFFQDVMLNRQELVTYLQLLLGYSITGHLNEQKFIIFWGALGSNGKSILIELIRNLLEDKKYYASLSSDAIMKIGKQSPGTATPHLAPLYGSRIAFLDESEKDAKLNEGIVKRITGNSAITIRKLYEEEFSFESSCQVILVTNHRPKISDENAMHRRLILIPFNAQFKDKNDYDPKNPKHKLRDKNKGEKLMKCKQELLVWLVHGCIKWYNHGLPELPNDIKQVTDQYKEESNMLLQFINKYCQKPVYDSDGEIIDEKEYYIEEIVLKEAYYKFSNEELTIKQFRYHMEKIGYISHKEKYKQRGFNLKYDPNGLIDECHIYDI